MAWLPSVLPIGLAAASLFGGKVRQLTQQAVFKFSKDRKNRIPV
jgi:hypothetical protein